MGLIQSILSNENELQNESNLGWSEVNTHAVPYLTERYGGGNIQHYLHQRLEELKNKGLVIDEDSEQMTRASANNNYSNIFANSTASATSDVNPEVMLNEMSGGAKKKKTKKNKKAKQSNDSDSVKSSSSNESVKGDEEKDSSDLESLSDLSSSSSSHINASSDILLGGGKRKNKKSHENKLTNSLYESYNSSVYDTTNSASLNTDNIDMINNL